MSSKPKVLIFSLAPPENHAGVRVVLYRHFIEREDFDFRLVTDTVFVTEGHPHLKVDLNRFLRRLRITRLHKWVEDWKNLIWPYCIPKEVDRLVKEYQPDVIMTVADNSLSQMALRVSQKHKIPLVGLFLDWVPVMNGYYGNEWTKKLLSQRFEKLYQQCDLAMCTSEGMKEKLGEHPNSLVIYPMPAAREVSQASGFPVGKHKFRLLYAGSIENFYGRMLCQLIRALPEESRIELQIVGPNPDWPAEMLKYAKDHHIYLGYKNSEELTHLYQEADFLLVVMSFEEQHRLFMETSFTTKYLDYSAWGKPIIVWSPAYSSPARITQSEDCGLLVDQSDPQILLGQLSRVLNIPEEYERLSKEAIKIRNGIFNPDSLQKKLFDGISTLMRRNS